MPEIRFGGGLNENDALYVDAEECTTGQNFILDASARTFRPRPPQDLVGTAPNAGTIYGIHQLIKRDGTTTTIAIAGSTAYKVQSPAWSSVATVATSPGRFKDTHWSLDDFIVITDINKANVVKKWTGSSFANLTHGISGVTNLYAKYSAVYGGRVWLANVKTDSTDYPHMILVSEYEEPEGYSTTTSSNRAGYSELTGNEGFWLLSPDLRPINGLVAFYDTLICSTVDGKLFRVTGNDATDYALVEFYPGSAATGWDSIVNIGNDVAYLKRDGIDLISSTDQYGDTRADDLSRWIPTSGRGLSDSIAIYDQAQQRVYWFVTNQVLVLDKEYMEETQAKLSPWSIWKTKMSNAFNTNAARYLKTPGTTDYTVWWGDSAGNVYDMNGVGASGDNGDTNILTKRRTRLVTELNTRDRLFRGRVEHKRRGVCTLQMSWTWAETFYQSNCAVPLKAPTVVGGTAFYGGAYYYSGSVYYRQDYYQDQFVTTAGFTPTGKSYGALVELSIDDTVDFLITRLFV